MSGAGRSTAANVLEDLGWFVVDNLPPGAAPDAWSSSAAGRRATCRGSRPSSTSASGRSSPTSERRSTDARERAAVDPRIVFLEASDDALVRRFEAVRRPHPLQGDGRIIDGIAARARAARATCAATPTSSSTPATSTSTSCAPRSRHAFAGTDDPALQATRDLVRLQVRPAGRRRPGGRLPLPAEPALGAGAATADRAGPSGQRVRARAAGRGRVPRRLRRAARASSRPATCARASASSTVAVGCTGGKHRSVAMAEELARRLAAAGVESRGGPPRPGA